MTTVAQDTEERTVKEPDSLPPPVIVERQSVQARTMYQQREVYANYPPFQRDKVWRKPFKVDLVDTMIRGLPIPPLSMIVRRDKAGYHYDVIDGQQRQQAMFEFMENKFKTGTGSLPDGDQGEEYLCPGLYYKQLPQEAQWRINSYSVPIEVYSSINEASVGLSFRRQNRNQMPLTAAELLSSHNTHATRAAMRFVAEKEYLTGGDSPLYTGSTRHRQPFYMLLDVLLLEAMGGFAALSPGTISALAKGTKDVQFTPAFLNTISRRLDAMHALFYGTHIATVGHIVPLYQAVLLLDSAGYDIEASEQGALTSWYAGVLAESHAQRERGSLTLSARMHKVYGQKDFWKTHLLDIVRRDGIRVRENESETMYQLSRMLRWMEYSICSHCKTEVRLVDSPKHFLVQADYQRNTTPGNCREDRFQHVC